MRAVVLALCVTGSSASLGQEADSGGYLGAGFGELSYEQEIVAAIYTFDESAGAWKIYGGYAFNEVLGLELSWTETQELEDSFTALDPDVGSVSTAVGVELSVLSLRAMAHLPLSWGSLFAGIGYFDGDADATLVVSSELLGTETFTASDSESGATAIAGLLWRLGSWNARLEYEWWDVDTADLTALNLSLAYRF